MFRIIAILLLPFLVAGNSLAHSHGAGTHQSQGHGRAHFHLSGDHGHAEAHDAREAGRHSHKGHHHDHDHDDEHKDESSERVPTLPLDHDSDAVYVVAPDYVFTVPAAVSLDLTNQLFAGTSEVQRVELRPFAYRDVRRESLPAELPLYLFHAALRL